MADSSHQKKKIIFVRHGRSYANEYMDTDGNRWGDPTFTDDLNLVDSKLSEHGRKQAKLLGENLKSHILPNLERAADSLLIVISPLTRALETFDIAFNPLLADLQQRWTSVEVLAHPLATERVYTSSDTGRYVSELKESFACIDFESAFLLQSKGYDDDFKLQKWWFHLNPTDEYIEWRPHGQGQYYAVPGEPEHVFHQRMHSFSTWLTGCDESCIIVITHWAVIKWFCDCEIENCATISREL